MIVRWPGMQKGAVVKGFYDNTDLTPTVQELLGTPMFSDRYHYDGNSLQALRMEQTAPSPMRF